MTAPLLCAHRCATIQALVLRDARSSGQTVEVARINAGLAREYVPLPVVAHPCAVCTAVHTSPLAAAECCDRTSQGAP